MPSINYGETIIHYFHFKQSRKDIKISVDLINGIEVYTPINVSDAKLANIVRQKAPWITQKLMELNEIKTTIHPIEFVSGEKLPYLGRYYKLKVFREPIQDSNIKLLQGRFIATVTLNSSQEYIQQTLKKQLIKWYQLHGSKKIAERASYYQSILGIEPHSLQLKTQHKRWGTCTPNGDIYLNWRIVMAPLRVIDYIIVHELAHLVVPEHNDKFWRLVRTTLPHYKEAKEWLRVNGYSVANLFI
ncbi:M48 family metallopeptidase [Gracilibacillus dipsosauri]|uniref:M48 family peptidase n=1 Tax=Gracilibacillus dipsosauri TaxID=178340 RepID=A0A317L508_9BACI|nr:SprT family zinc-dependent metalloprotease [Gracilibacillus dipsosauri]PWU69948.1 M48 family peptidase [Gracilibacillus dipsosauri]